MARTQAEELLDKARATLVSMEEIGLMARRLYPVEGKQFLKRVMSHGLEINDFLIALLREDESLRTYAAEHHPRMLEVVDFDPPSTGWRSLIDPAQTLAGWRPDAKQEK